MKVSYEVTSIFLNSKHDMNKLVRKLIDVNKLSANEYYPSLSLPIKTVFNNCLLSIISIYFHIQSINFLERNLLADEIFHQDPENSLYTTFSSITFLSVTRADSKTYDFSVQPAGGFGTNTVELIVQCKYNVIMI